eukprot:371138-Hanusia_phi.AAC.2
MNTPGPPFPWDGKGVREVGGFDWTNVSAEDSGTPAPPLSPRPGAATQRPAPGAPGPTPHWAFQDGCCQVRLSAATMSAAALCVRSGASWTQGTVRHGR